MSNPMKEKKIDAIPSSSPERINRLIGRTSPVIWIVLSLVLALLVAVIVVGCTIPMRATLDIVVTNEYTFEGVDDQYLSGYCTPENFDNIQVGQTVLVGDREFVVAAKGPTPAKMYFDHYDSGALDIDGLILHEMGLEEGSFVHLILMAPADGKSVQLEDSLCIGKVVTDEITLISLLLD